MPGDVQIWLWLGQNAPSIATGVITTVLLLRIQKFISRQNVMEKRQRRQMEICASKNPEHARKLFDDEGD